MTNTNNTTSYAALLRTVARENDRRELAREIGRIWDATHVAIYQGRIYAYGTEADAVAFADGLSRVEVRAITEREQADLARSKRQAYGNP